MTLTMWKQFRCAAQSAHLQMWSVQMLLHRKHPHRQITRPTPAAHCLFHWKARVLKGKARAESEGKNTMQTNVTFCVHALFSLLSHCFRSSRRIKRSPLCMCVWGHAWFPSMSTKRFLSSYLIPFISIARGLIPTLIRHLLALSWILF